MEITYEWTMQPPDPEGCELSSRFSIFENHRGFWVYDNHNERWLGPMQRPESWGEKDYPLPGRSE